jgi:hypothetical protein
MKSPGGITTMEGQSAQSMKTDPGSLCACDCDVLAKRYNPKKTTDMGIVLRLIIPTISSPYILPALMSVQMFIVYHRTTLARFMSYKYVILSHQLSQTLCTGLNPSNLLYGI